MALLLQFRVLHLHLSVHLLMASTRVYDVLTKLLLLRSVLSNGKELLGMRSDADNVQITAHQVRNWTGSYFHPAMPSSHRPRCRSQ